MNGDDRTGVLIVRVWRERGDVRVRVFGRLTGKFDVYEPTFETAAAESVDEIVALAACWLRTFEGATGRGDPPPRSP